MEISTASLLLAIVSAAMSLTALVRTREIAKFNIEMQRWAWRQKFLQNVASLTGQLTKAEILLSQLVFRVNEVESKIKQIHPTWASSLVNHEAVIAGIARAKQEISERQQIVKEFSSVVIRAWNILDPDTNLDAEIHRHATRIENVILSVSNLFDQLDEHALHLMKYSQPRVEA